MDDIAVATLLSLSADSKDRDVRGVVEAALANLSILSCSRANIVDTGAVGILKNMVGTKAVRAGTPSTADADARATVAHVLCNLTTMKINQPEMIKQQVDRVVHVLVEGADCIGREYLSLALANFACHEVSVFFSVFSWSSLVLTSSPPLPSGTTRYWPRTPRPWA